MRHVPAMPGGVPSRSLLHRLPIVLATVGCLTLLVGSASAGPTTQQQQTTQPQKALTADEVKALQQKAEQGDARAQCTLGDAYRSGRGVPQDDEQAVMWCRKAAVQGLAEAQFNLGMMYSTGKGVPEDYAEAQKWRNLAATLATGEGQKYYADGRDTLAKDMTPTQIAEAQNRASEWLAVFEKRKK